MSNSPFIERLMARRREISAEIERAPRNTDGTVSLSATTKLRKERKAIDEAIERHQRQKVDHG